MSSLSSGNQAKVEGAGQIWYCIEEGCTEIALSMKLYDAKGNLSCVFNGPYCEPHHRKHLTNEKGGYQSWCIEAGCARWAGDYGCGKHGGIDYLEGSHEERLLARTKVAGEHKCFEKSCTQIIGGWIYGPYCPSHAPQYVNMWNFCVAVGCCGWAPEGSPNCAAHGGKDYLPSKRIQAPVSVPTTICLVPGCGANIESFPPEAYCDTHSEVYLDDWCYCSEERCWNFIPTGEAKCSQHGGRDYPETKTPAAPKETFPSIVLNLFCPECGEPMSCDSPRWALDEEASVVCACGAAWGVRARDIRKDTHGRLEFRLEISHRTFRVFGAIVEDKK